MKLIDSHETVMLVTGSGPAATEKDRPLAEWLKAEIDRRGEGHTYRRALIVSDERFFDSRALEPSPAIAIGGPGVNALAAECVGAAPTVWNLPDQAWIQADFEGDMKRAALWGVDATATRIAVEAFVAQGFLDDLLDRIWRFRGPVFV
ncbi:MAG: hypothetical protein ACOY71_08420 [Gemmatimonadota bacterium]